MKLENLLGLPKLFRTIKKVDNVVDNIGDALPRTQFTAFVIQSLTSNFPCPLDLDEESIQVLTVFRQIDVDIIKPALINLFVDTEKLRSVTNPQKYAELTAQDGINTAIVLLLFLGLNPKNPIYRPFFAAAAFHKLTDSINDLPEDVDSKKVSVLNNQTTINAMKQARLFHLTHPFS